MNCFIGLLLFFTVHAAIHESNSKHLFKSPARKESLVKNEKSELNGIQKRVKNFIGKLKCVGSVCESVDIGKVNARIVAIGDIHGDYEKTVKLLMNSQLIDQEHQWIGGTSILIQLGDILDRGPIVKAYDTYQLLQKLQQEANCVGGKVILLLGNHEVMNLRGYYRDAYRKEDHARAKKLKDRIFAPSECTQLTMALNERSCFGGFLRQLPMIVNIHRTIFVHGGISDTYAELGISELNERLATVLKNVVPGKNITRQQSELLSSGRSPLWYRAYAHDPEGNCEQLKKVLCMLNADRMVIAHTPRFKRITQHCDGKLFLIDVKMSRYTTVSDTGSALQLVFRGQDVQTSEITLNCHYPSVKTVNELAVDEIHRKLSVGSDFETE